jgi:hypothetical protein
MATRDCVILFDEVHFTYCAVREHFIAFEYGFLHVLIAMATFVSSIVQIDEG